MIMKIILLIPLVLYFGIVFFNMDLLSATETIRFFNFHKVEVPIYLYLTFFVSIYVIFVYLIFSFLNGLTRRKQLKLENEVFELKSKLYDDREDELNVFMKEQKTRLENAVKEQKLKLESHLVEQNNMFEKYKTENNTYLSQVKSETDRILDKLNLLDKTLLDKIKDGIKGKK